MTTDYTNVSEFWGMMAGAAQLMSKKSVRAYANDILRAPRESQQQQQPKPASMEATAESTAAAEGEGKGLVQDEKKLILEPTAGEIFAMKMVAETCQATGRSAIITGRPTGAESETDGATNHRGGDYDPAAAACPAPAELVVAQVADLAPAAAAAAAAAGPQIHVVEELQTLVAMPAVPGQPTNFGTVVPGVYRSSYPSSPEVYDYIRDLKLKTIVTLVQKEFPEGYETFISNNEIRHHVFNMSGTKKEAIPDKTMKAILRLVLDTQNHPILIHCNHGRHRTGCVVAIVRLVSGWEHAAIVEEYKKYATPKVRDCDIDYITNFNLSKISNRIAEDTNIQHRMRSFVRTTLFSFFVLLIWLLTGVWMPRPSKDI